MTKIRTRIYIGGPLFTPSQQNVLGRIREWLKEDERFEYFDPREDSAKIWKGRAPKDCTDEDREKVFRANADNVVWANVLIAWVGGMDEITHHAADQLVVGIQEDSASGTTYPAEIDHFLEIYARDWKPAPADTGVTWEMGFAFGWNQAIETVENGTYMGDSSHDWSPTSILAYIDDFDDRQSMNLMLERGVDGVAPGFEQLKEALILYHENGRFAGTVNLDPEQEPVV